mmetsp:Transcript_44660/g.80313  ORF Transcript_44660/g.80313 Transcript_44660/m.80313 type:complete len:229 (-) Transcript_44660:222-908(-)
MTPRLPSSEGCKQHSTSPMPHKRPSVTISKRWKIRANGFEWSCSQRGRSRLLPLLSARASSQGRLCRLWSISSAKLQRCARSCRRSSRHWHEPTSSRQENLLTMRWTLPPSTPRVSFNVSGKMLWEGQDDEPGFSRRRCIHEANWRAWMRKNLKGGTRRRWQPWVKRPLPLFCSFLRWIPWPLNSWTHALWCRSPSEGSLAFRVLTRRSEWSLSQVLDVKPELQGLDL